MPGANDREENSLIQLISQPKEEPWEKVAIASGGAHEQSFAFGQASQMIQHSSPVRLLVLKDGEPVACMQGVGKTRIPSALIKVGGMSGGPVIHPELAKDEDLTAKLIYGFEREAKRSLIGNIILYCWNKSLLSKICQKYGYSQERKILVFEVDMENGPEHLWNRMKPNKRRKIRQAQRKGVTVMEMTEPDIDLAYGMFQAAAQRGGFKPISRSWLKAYLKAYGSRRMACIYTASIGEKPVSCALIIRHGRTAYCPAAGSYKEGWHARPNDFMHWKIMEMEYSRGMTRYNMGGVSTDPDSSSYGVYQWKKEYGGHTRELNVLSKVINPALLAIRTKLGSVRRI